MAKQIQLGAIQDTFAEYLGRRDCLSSSDIAALLVSGNEYLRKRAQPAEDKKHLRLGSAVHCMLTEFFNFEDQFPVYDPAKRPEPEKNFGSTKNKAWRFAIEHEAKQAGKTLLSLDDLAEVKMRKTSIETNDSACKLLNDCTDFETSYYAEIRIGDRGYYMRCRPDAVAPDYFVSIKTTKAPRPEDFPRECAKYGYQIKEAVYWIVLNAVRRALKMPPVKNAYIIAVGETETFVYELNPPFGQIDGVSSYLNTGIHLMDIALKRFDRIQKGEVLNASVNYGGQEVFPLFNPTYHENKLQELIDRENGNDTGNDGE
jgi:hypothetical protein